LYVESTDGCCDLHKAVVVELVVTGQCDETSPAW